MQTTIYHWFLYLCLCLYPLGADANVDSQTAVNSASANAAVAKTYRHFPKANPLDRFRILKNTGLTLEKRPNTEGSSDPDKSVKKARFKRFWRIFGLVVGSLALVYFLQGTIWLALATLAIGLYFFNRKKIEQWDRDRYARAQSVDDGSLDKDSKGNPIYPLNHPANKWTRRAINRFAIGLVLGGIGIVFALLGFIFGGGSSLGGLAIFGLLALGVGYGFSIVGFFNACQAVANKEPKQSFAWLIIILSLPVVISLLGFVLSVG